MAEGLKNRDPGALMSRPSKWMFNRATNAWEEIPDDRIQQAFQSGQYGLQAGAQVPVVDTEGKAWSIPAEEAAQAFGTGRFKYETTEALQERQAVEKFQGPAAAAAAAGLGFARTLSMGLTDKVLAQGPPIPQFGEEGEFLGSVKLRDEPGVLDAADYLRLLREQQKAASTAGEIAGAVAPMLLLRQTGLTGAANARMVQAITGGVPRNAAEAAMARVLPMIVGGAAEGTFYGAGEAISQAALGKEDLTAEKLLAGVGMGAFLGGATGGVFGAGGLLTNKARSIARGVIQRSGASRSVAEWAREMSEKQAVNALSPGKVGVKHLQKVKIEGKTLLNILGRDLLDEIPGFAKKTVEEIGEDAALLANKYGEEIGAIVRQLDDIGVVPLEEQLTRTGVAQKIMDDVIEPLRGIPAYKQIIRQLEGQVDELLEAEADRLTIGEAQRIKRGYDQFLNFEKEQSAGKEALKSLRRTLNKEIEGAVDRYGKHIDDPEVLSRFKEVKRKFGSFRSAEEWAVDKSARMDNNRWWSPSDYISTAMGFLSGSTTSQGLVRGGILGGLNHMARTRGPQVAAGVLDKMSKLSALQASNEAASKRIKAAAQRLLRPRKGAAPITRAASTRALISTYYGADPRKPRPHKKDDRVEAFRARYAELAGIQADPREFAERVNRMSASMDDVAPGVSQQIKGKAARAAAFLYEKAPKNPAAARTLNPAVRAWRPSDVQLARFERYVQAVEDPIGVFESMGQGYISREGAETLREVYPALYDEAQQVFVEELAELKTAIPYRDRLTLGRLFQIPTDASLEPDFVAAMQGIHATEPEPEDTRAPGLSPKGAGKLTLAEATETTAQRIASERRT